MGHGTMTDVILNKHLRKCLHGKAKAEEALNVTAAKASDKNQDLSINKSDEAKEQEKPRKSKHTA